MFTWEDKARAASEKSQSLTLRPENTAGVVRSYIEHELGRSGLLRSSTTSGRFPARTSAEGTLPPVLSNRCGSSWPTLGGNELPMRDAEVLDMLTALLDAVGLKGWTLYLNSVGCLNCRPARTRLCVRRSQR